MNLYVWGSYKFDSSYSIREVSNSVHRENALNKIKELIDKVNDIRHLVTQEHKLRTLSNFSYGLEKIRGYFYDNVLSEEEDEFIGYLIPVRCGHTGNIDLNAFDNMSRILDKANF